MNVELLHTFQPVTFESHTRLVEGLTDVAVSLQKHINDIVPQLLSLDFEGLNLESPFKVSSLKIMKHSRITVRAIAFKRVTPGGT